MRAAFIKRITCAALALLLTLMIFAPVAFANRLRVVRVGFFAFDGYHVQAENGDRSGYGYELLQNMLGYTNWQLEYVGYDKSWSEMQEMLANGEIDLLSSAQKTPEREKQFDFSEQPIGTSTAILTLKAGNLKYTADDVANWSGMRIGMLKDNSRNESLAAYAAAQGFTYEPVFFEDTSVLLEALQEDVEIDAVLTSNLRATKNEWTIAQFASSPFYIMVRKGDSELLASVNSALSQLFLDEKGIRTRLMDKYYSPEIGEHIAFTAEEREFISQMSGKSFTAVVNPDRAPLSYFEDGEPHGIISDIAEALCLRSGLTINILETSSRAEYKALLESDTVDLRLDNGPDYNDSERMGYRLTAPYIDVSLAKLSRKDGGEQKKVAMLRDSDIERLFNVSFASEYDVVAGYDTIADVVNAVQSGEQDVAYLYRRTAELYAELDYTNSLVVEDVYGQNGSFSIGVSENCDSCLFSIMNKCVVSLSEHELETLVSANTTERPKEFSIVEYIYDNPFVALATLIVLFLVIVFIFTIRYSIKKRRRDTQKLTEEQRKNELLSDALAAAERADAAKSQFLSRVSHEMRTPLNAIIGFMELAADAGPEQMRVYLENSSIAARQLLSVINDVLDMSAIEAGKLRLANVPFDFKKLLRSVGSIYTLQCREKGITYETKLLTPFDEWLIGDPLRVNQIMLNLLSNAVKFTEKGEVLLSVSQLSEKPESVFIRFIVSDTGCGIAPELQERLFKPFEQGDAAMAIKHGGSGLGLSIVKNLTTMMGGSVRVESELGRGTTFTVDLPFGRSVQHIEPLLLTDAHELRVLAIDDEESERLYMAAVLQHIGVRFETADGCDSALSLLECAQSEGNGYNICLIDWRMPDTDGIETVRRIREQYGEKIVLILVSAYDENKAREDAENAGANMFISKPIFRSSLLDAFMTLTGGRLNAEEQSKATFDFSGRRILLAEDNAMNRMVAEGLIKRFGAECETAENGEEAVSKFLASPAGYFDTILMDIQMPVMDGYVATHAIRSSDHPEAATAQIIALTANAFNEDVIRALSAGMNAHVAKPIEPETLIATLQKAILQHDAAMDANNKMDRQE